MLSAHPLQYHIILCCLRPLPAPAACTCLQTETRATGVEREVKEGAGREILGTTERVLGEVPSRPLKE